MQYGPTRKKDPNSQLQIVDEREGGEEGTESVGNEASRDKFV